MDKPKDYLCPKCNGVGYILFQVGKYEYSKPCECRALKEAKDRLRKSGLANEFKTKTFDTYDTNNDSVLEDAKNTAMRFTQTVMNKPVTEAPSLMLCGQVGAGKTHLGTASSVMLIENGIAVIYMGYREEMTALKSRVMDDIAYANGINKFKNAKILFIDDFLKGKITESDLNIVYEIINYRYNNNMPVIISTEKTLEELLEFDEAIGSRLIEMSRGYIVVLKGDRFNYRLYGGR